MPWFPAAATTTMLGVSWAIARCRTSGARPSPVATPTDRLSTSTPASWYSARRSAKVHRGIVQRSCGPSGSRSSAVRTSSTADGAWRRMIPAMKVACPSHHRRGRPCAGGVTMASGSAR